MKNYLLLLALILSLNSIAQNYIPIPESNAVWIQASFLYGMNGHEHSTVTNPLSFGQDTVAGGQAYHKLQGHEIVEWIDGWGNQQNYATGMYTVQGYKLFFRQDIPTKKVYAWYEGRDTLLYDFDLTVGQVYPETLTNINYPNLKVLGEDSVQLLDGVYHRKWLLGTESADSGYISLIEGVGATSGFSLTMYPLFEQSGAIMCLKESNNQLYENWGESGLISAQYSELCDANVSILEIVNEKTELQVWPNPSNNKVNVRFDKGIESVSVIDMCGKTVIYEKGFDFKELELNVESLKSGHYIVRITTVNQERFFGTLSK